MTYLLLMLVAVAIQLPAQQSESDRKSFEVDKAGAEIGEAAAQHNLGVCYANGQGVAKDAVEAVKWYRRAAEQNFASAQFNLANCYYNGQGVAKDAVAAVKWYGKAAEQNYAEAQFNLGVCFKSGDGVTRDAVEAVRWWRKAAEQNLATAQDNLGLCYYNGEGVAKDAVEAANWFRKAAEQNYAPAQVNMSACYVGGQGVATNYVEAYKWRLLAAAQGDEMAKKTVTALEKLLSREQVAEGQKLARNFKSLEGMKSNKQIGEAVAGWKRYSSQEGGFSIEFPEAPEAETIKGRMNDTRFKDAYFLKSEKNEAAYSAGYAHIFDDILKEFSPEQILDAARDGALATTQGKLLYELAISKDGFQGREIVFLASGLSSRVRIYLVGNRKYVLGVVGQGAKDAKATTVFLNSFQFISKQTPPR